MLENYTPVLLQIVIAAGFAVSTLIFSAVAGKSARRNAMKDSAYECGMLPLGDAQPRFSVKFYIVAMLFVLFDIEVVFLVPWALVYREFLAAGIAITAATAVFLGVLVLGLAYEFKRGALEWEK